LWKKQKTVDERGMPRYDLLNQNERKTDMLFGSSSMMMEMCMGMRCMRMPFSAAVSDPLSR
jgi:hypothetical protein